MKLIPALAAAAALTIAGSAFAADASDEAFLKKAIQGDISEMKIGELAEQKAESKQAKSFGKLLVTDHGKHKDKVSALAQSVGVTPPTDPTSEAQTEYDKLSKLSGDAFDSELATYMVDDHKKDIEDYTDEAKSAHDKKVRQLASSTLPTLKKHLKTAESLQTDSKK